MPMDVMAVLKRYGIRPSKALGQSFLVDRDVLRRIVTASQLTPEDVVLEVGPGLGQLTEALARAVSAVIAVELDERMLAVLAQELTQLTNVHIVAGDLLTVDPPAVIRQALQCAPDAPLAYKVVANLPYYITSTAIRHLLSADPRPLALTLMVQREVAERIVALPGALSLLALGVQVYGDPEIVLRVPARAFYPSPQVDSAVLRVQTLAQPRVPECELPRFFQVAQAGFRQKRKQLHNSLVHNLHLTTEVVRQALEMSGIAPERRPQTLSIAEWAALARALPTAPSSH
jgi:16S rRNA (adenine1518-N6/adenine1519-N6)-dimethyltransferase